MSTITAPFEPATEAEKQAAEEARQAATADLADRFLKELADRIGAHVGTDVSFGAPVERGDVTIVPVARVRWGFGGGLGSGTEERRPGAASKAQPGTMGSGAGGGGGSITDPIGYLEIRSTGATFKPLESMRPSAMFLVAAGITAALVLRGLARLLGR
jgi:uncharacterized spore protein YtfJ